MVVTYSFVGDDETEKFLLGAREIAATATTSTVYSPQSRSARPSTATRGRHGRPTPRPTARSSTVEIVDAVPYTG